MSTTDNIGGFRPPSTSDSSPDIGPSTVSEAASYPPQIQSNNPYRQALPSEGFSPSLEPGPSAEHPSYDPPPPAYELVAGTAPSGDTADSKRGWSQGSTLEAQPSDRHPPAHPFQQGQSNLLSQQDQPMVPQASSSSILTKAPSISRNPLNPPPPCFGRVLLPPSEIITYERLSHPFVIRSDPGKKFLDDAFPTTGVPALYKHDVLAEDWVRLLEDIQAVSRLTGGERIVAGVLPVVMHLPILGLASRVVKKVMKDNNVGNVSELLDAWNEHFFKPRRLEIMLCRGDRRVSGDLGKSQLAPDHASSRAPYGDRADSSSSSDSSSSESEDSRSERRQTRREQRAERREQRRARRDERRVNREVRRAERRARRAERRKGKRSIKEDYRLIVVSI